MHRHHPMYCVLWKLLVYACYLRLASSQHTCTRNMVPVLKEYFIEPKNSETMQLGSGASKYCNEQVNLLLLDI